MIRVIAGLLIAVVSAVALAQAPANPPVRIRGTVEKLDGQILTIKANNEIGRASCRERVCYVV